MSESPDPLPCGSVCEALQRMDKEADLLNIRIARLEREVHLLVSRVRTLTYILVGGMALDLIVNTAKASSFLGR